MPGKTTVRTFREFMQAYPHAFSTYHFTRSCRRCRKSNGEAGGLWKYSVRHYICNGCISNRLDEVMPDVIKRERFEKKWNKAGAQ